MQLISIWELEAEMDELDVTDEDGRRTIGVRGHPSGTQLVGVGLSALAGIVSGAIGAYSYYDDVLGPLAHTFGIWVLLIATVSARKSARWAMLRGIAALSTAVFAFYVGKQVMYGFRYPGLPYDINVAVLGLWFLFALAAGAGLGWAFCSIGRRDIVGSLSLAVAIGLLIADALDRILNYRDEAPVLVVFAVAAIAAICVLARIRQSQALATVILAIPMAGLGYAAVLTPDLLEQLIFVGWR